MSAASDGPGLSFVPKDVLKAMERISRAGFDVWLVGGALRDFFLGIEPRDWDLATNAASVEIISLFPSVIPVGMRHGTVQVHTKTRDIEVTSIGATDKAGIFDDLARRDFTINSLALTYPEGEVLDPNAGRKDLKAGLVKAVGAASDRFLEDPLRIVRAARICGIYGFRIDPATFEAMRDHAGRLSEVSGERIRDEILKILTSQNLSLAFELLEKSGGLEVMVPALGAASDIEFGAGVSPLDHTISCILNCPARIRIRLAAFFHKAGMSRGGEEARRDLRSPSAEVAVETMKSWNMSNRLIDEVETIVSRRLGEEASSWSDPRLRRFITEVGRELLDDFMDLAEAEVLSGVWGLPAGTGEIERLRARMKTQLGLISAFSVRELALSGNDVIKILGIKPGPEVGKVLKELFDLVQEDPGLNTRESLTGIVEKKFRAAGR